MDLARVKNEDKLNMCRKYFLGGFGFLPFLWAINVVWFFSESFRKPYYEQQKQIKMYWIFSLIGAVVWLGILSVWISVFQTQRVEWGATADSISFILPKGVP